MTGVIGVVCSTALIGAALWLESICRIPPSQDDQTPPGAVRS